MTAPNTAPPTVLVVEDQDEIRGALRRVLEELGARVIEASTGEQGIALAAGESPDLVVLDLGLPDVQGDEVCRAVRSTSHVPIVVVSARHSEEEKVRLLDAGADDYLTKPFGPAELAARVRAHLRRAQRADTPAAPRALRLGDLELDVVNRVATRAGMPVHLTPIEWGLLRALAAEPGRTLTHQQLFDAVWRREYGNAAQYLRVHVTNLRRKVEPNPSLPVYIVTEPGVGYRLELSG
ncbi:response regulator receiver [Gemmatirosa kalamazoonensis]|uniref:Response regulator receiver n=1 Tax=Gemmatirosa kalamazoonensis TaxID=861299 RepID=W0RFK7_9BACT|nr:response regulator transcription factor [Gemmatirosa kalamazoonensis]AHG89125.1 response regulator receiver [Gemmatirosa kalamazoonensis]